jgi:hypothetical protein
MLVYVSLNEFLNVPGRIIAYFCYNFLPAVNRKLMVVVCCLHTITQSPIKVIFSYGIQSKHGRITHFGKLMDSDVILDLAIALNICE